MGTFGVSPWMVRRAAGALLAALALLAAALPAASAASSPGASAGTAPASGSTPAAPTSAAKPAPPTAVVAMLSNLKTLTRYAYPEAAASAHQFPNARSRVVGSLHFLTPDGQAEVYLALRSYRMGSTTWIEVPLPGRPNGRTGWVQASALGEFHVVHQYIRVDRETLRLTLFRDGRPLFSAPVGVGRPSLPTPTGHFYVTEKLQTVGGPVYGPYALGTSAYAPTLSEWPGGGVVGIHGTDEPQLIPGYPSHGCIRLRNEDITRLYQLVQVGTPIEIV